MSYPHICILKSQDLDISLCLLSTDIGELSIWETRKKLDMWELLKERPRKHPRINMTDSMYIKILSPLLKSMSSTSITNYNMSFDIYFIHHFLVQILHKDWKTMQV